MKTEVWSAAAIFVAVVVGLSALLSFVVVPYIAGRANARRDEVFVTRRDQPPPEVYLDSAQVAGARLAEHNLWSCPVCKDRRVESTTFRLGGEVVSGVCYYRSGIGDDAFLSTESFTCQCSKGHAWRFQATFDERPVMHPFLYDGGSLLRVVSEYDAVVIKPEGYRFHHSPWWRAVQ